MDRPVRKQIRLDNYDYSKNGLYFITICTKDHATVFWKPLPDVGATLGRPLSEYRSLEKTLIGNFKNALTDVGVIVDKEINNIRNCYDNCVFVDRYVVMPNHIHFIIRLIGGSCGEGGRPKVAPTISRVIQQFKGAVTKKIGFQLWQKSYYDRIIRNEKEYIAISAYIHNNPFKWDVDEYNPKNENNKMEVQGVK